MSHVLGSDTMGSVDLIPQSPLHGRHIYTFSLLFFSFLFLLFFFFYTFFHFVTKKTTFAVYPNLAIMLHICTNQSRMTETPRGEWNGIDRTRIFKTQEVKTNKQNASCFFCS